MFISNAIYKSVPAVLPVPIAEGTIVTVNGLQVGEGDAAYGIVPQTVSAIPATGRIQVAVAGMIDLTSDANKAVFFTEDDMKALGADFNFVPGEEHSGGGGGGNDSGVIDRTIETCTNDEVEAIGKYAFAYCTSLSAASFANAAEIGASAFYSCGNLETITAPKVESISEHAFNGCSKLESASFGSVTSIGYYAFANCGKLAEASFPGVTGIGSNAFLNCSLLETAYMPELMSIGSYAFSNCKALNNVHFPKVTQIYSAAFSNCISLRTVSLPNLGSTTGISMSAFLSCTALESLYLLGSYVGKLNNVNAFANTPLSNSGYLGHWGSIYVKTSLLDTWKAANAWSTYKDRFVGLTDQQIEALG